MQRCELAQGAQCELPAPHGGHTTARATQGQMPQARQPVQLPHIVTKGLQAQAGQARTQADSLGMLFLAETVYAGQEQMDKL